MGLLDWVKKKKGLTLMEVKREEIKLGIRENKTLSKLEKLEKEREEIFSKGSKIKSPSRRRQLARLYDMKSKGSKMLERELAMLSKELTAISAIKLSLERQEMSRDGVAKILAKMSESELMVMMEDDKITSEMYMEKLNNVLSTITEGTEGLIADLGTEGNEVMDVWQKMDEGEIESFEDALKMADKAVRSKERDKELEAE